MNSLFQLKPFLFPYRFRILGALLSLMGLTGIEMTIPVVISRVVDQGLIARQVSVLIQAALVIVGLGLANASLSLLQRYLTESIAHKVAYDIRNRLYDHIQYLDFTYHDHIQSGQLISRCIEDVRSIQNFTGQGMIDLVRISVLIISIATILMIRNPHLALYALLPMVPLVLVTTNFGKRIGRFFLHVDQSLGELSSRLQENVAGVQVVRAFAREPYEIERFAQSNRKLYHARIQVMAEWSRMMPTTTFLVTLGTILILWFGGQMVLNGQLTLGELVAFNSYVLLLTTPAQQLGQLVNAAGEASAGVSRIMDVLHRVPEIRSKPDAVKLPPLAGRIQFHDISFHYVGEKTRALHHIDLDVQPNQVVALIGPTGSGKTSLVNLIPRFYDVTKGSLLIDGNDVRDVDLVSLRKQIGIVLQTSLLFSTTIRDNIAYGRPDATFEEVVEAAKAAQAHSFILDLPKGYDTIVGERGVTLSGGQRQRIAIARALIMDPRILILDDSTSSVDTQTEQQIQKALETLMEGRTTFVIAQRLSTVHRADLILVLENGRIIDRGKHTDLLKHDGLYRQIYELQMRDQEQFREEMERIQQAESQIDTDRVGHDQTID